MATPPPPPPYGYRPPPVAVRRSRAAGILMAVSGLLLLPCVFVLPWAGRDGFTRTLWQLRTDVREGFGRFAPIGERITYEMPAYLALAAVAVALLAGVLVIALGNRLANIAAILFGLLASVLAFAAVAWFFFRVEGYNALPRFFTENVHVGFYGMWLLSLLLLVGVVLALVGAIRAGKPKHPPAAPFQPPTDPAPGPQPSQYPTPPQQPGR